jgi:hypothetical protein
MARRPQGPPGGRPARLRLVRRRPGRTPAGGAPPYTAPPYRDLLGRAPDADCPANFGQEIADGLAPDYVTRQILATPEGRATRTARPYADEPGLAAGPVCPQGLPRRHLLRGSRERRLTAGAALPRDAGSDRRTPVPGGAFGGRKTGE